jgi:dihydrofolate reductase
VTVRQYLHEQLIDELHIAVSPILFESGESPFRGLDLLELGYK